MASCRKDGSTVVRYRYEGVLRDRKEELSIMFDIHTFVSKKGRPKNLS